MRHVTCTVHLHRLARCSAGPAALPHSPAKQRGEIINVEKKQKGSKRRHRPAPQSCLDVRHDTVQLATTLPRHGLSNVTATLSVITGYCDTNCPVSLPLYLSCIRQTHQQVMRNIVTVCCKYQKVNIGESIQSSQQTLRVFRPCASQQGYQRAFLRALTK
ncbi:hypothetical protein E2C01_014216 [Portunus trituberculatus]|uniref:Uncharacterized protein n=1 Tax=Portunus trituberculatus TaxID=210409 RepID=A0A5B7DIK5_PORTR|nr:hypothetical protein [Portunus trituberculatus]